MEVMCWSVGSIVAFTPPRAVDATRTVNPPRRAVRRPRLDGSASSLSRRSCLDSQEASREGSIKAQTHQIRSTSRSRVHQFRRIIQSK